MTATDTEIRALADAIIRQQEWQRRQLEENERKKFNRGRKPKAK